MRNTLMVAALASGLALTGCATDPNTGQQRLNKSAIGALAGAAGGAAISKATGGDKTGRDAAIGGVLGAGVGKLDSPGIPARHQPPSHLWIRLWRRCRPLEPGSGLLSAFSQWALRLPGGVPRHLAHR